MNSHHDHKVHEEMSKRSIEGYIQSLKDARATLGKSSPADPTVQELLAANEHLLHGPLELQSCGGSFSYAAAVIWGTLVTTPTLDFAGWGSLKFSGTHWGLGAGGGISYTVGFSTVHPEQLLGDIAYNMTFTGGPPGVVNINFFRKGTLLVSVSGPALNVGTPGSYGGTGTFTR